MNILKLHIEKSHVQTTIPMREVLKFEIHCMRTISVIGRNQTSQLFHDVIDLLEYSIERRRVFVFHETTSHHASFPENVFSRELNAAIKHKQNDFGSLPTNKLIVKIIWTFR